MSQPGRPRKQEQEPPDTEVTEVGPGVLRLQLPIRMPGLGHVNCYALEDEDGIAVVDPGLPGPASWKALVTRLDDAGFPLRRVHTVVVTHSHPDHYGGASRLADEAGAALVAHVSFQTWWSAPHRCADCEAGLGDDEHEHDEEAHPTGDNRSEGPPWTRPAPWGGTAFKPPLRRRLAFGVVGRFRRGRWSPPTPTRPVRDGDVLRLGRREWFARHTPGHTLDHLCLHDPTEGVLLSGDHVLPTITPHISGVGTGPDPLARFVASLDAVAGLDDVSRVLPAHGQPFDDLAGRVKAIKAHHADRLATLREVSAQLGWAPVEELSRHLFAKRSWGAMAASETYAHLEHLRLAGEAEHRRVDGQLEYRVK